MVNLERLRSLAKEKGLSLSYICSQLGVARIYFNDVEKHNRDIPEKRLAKIAELLDTTPEYLRDETDDPSPKQKKPAAMSDELWEKINNDPSALKFLELLYSMNEEQISELERFIITLQENNEGP